MDEGEAVGFGDVLGILISSDVHMSWKRHTRDPSKLLSVSIG